MNGVLLVNLGTPDSPRAGDVGRYLREFLSDPRVVDLPRWFWLPLLYGVIVPLRAPRSARAYAKIWTGHGSPLMVNSQALADALEKRLDGQAAVRLAMRYGSPSVREVMQRMRATGVQRLCVIPLYPQYSHTTTGSVLDAVEAAQQDLAWEDGVHVVRDYFGQPGWPEAVADAIRRFQARNGVPERLVFSMHGIPERYVRQGDPYAEQCRQSVAAISAALDGQCGEPLLTFQSRVGREPWLQPYTDKTVIELARNGIRHVQVVCPGFAADCLETLEEIAMEARELFLEHGGERFEYIPALNDAAAHVELLAVLALNQLGDGAQSPR